MAVGFKCERTADRGVRRRPLARIGQHQTILILRRRTARRQFRGALKMRERVIQAILTGQRKAKIARRLRNEERLGAATAGQKSVAAPKSKSRDKAGETVSA